VATGDAHALVSRLRALLAVLLGEVERELMIRMVRKAAEATGGARNRAAVMDVQKVAARFQPSCGGFCLTGMG
jgi:hypothetical protein